MLTLDQFRSAASFARDGSLFPDSPWHGELHWRGVAAQGLLICDMMNLDASARATAALFGAFHDCRRENEDYDPEHGARGAEAMLSWAADNADLDAGFLAELETSMILHDGGETTDEVNVGLGWDADRSLLTRVGISPSFAFFSVIHGDHFIDLIDTGFEINKSAPDWDAIWLSAFGA